MADPDPAGTATVERAAEPGCRTLEQVWDAEWEDHLLSVALERVKRSANPAHYKTYHLRILQKLSVQETARALGISVAAVYFGAHRVRRQVKAELKRLENLALKV